GAPSRRGYPSRAPPLPRVAPDGGCTPPVGPSSPLGCAAEASATRRALAQRTGAGGDDRVAFGQTAEDLDILALFRADLDAAEDRGLVARLEHAAPAAEIDHGVDRYDQRGFLDVGGDADARVHARLEAELAIGDFDFDRRGPRRGIEHRR